MRFAAPISIRWPQWTATWSASIPAPNTVPPSPSSQVIVSRVAAVMRPAVTVVPVTLEGQASRTKYASSGSAGAGSASGLASCRLMLAAQPVAPVPVAAMLASPRFGQHDHNPT